MRHNHENRPVSRSTEADDNALDPPTDEPETEPSTPSTPSVGRRGYLGLLGAGVGSALFGTQPASAQAGGYGAGEYGLGSYGDTEDGSVADPPDEPDDEPVDDEPTDDESADDAPASVLTVSADPEASAATLSGLVWTLDEADSASTFFEYRQVDAEQWAETAASTQSKWGAFERTVTDLDPSTEYEYRAVVTVGDDSSVGESQSFRTLATDSSSPSVDQLSLTDVSSTENQIELLVDWEVSDPDGDLDSVSVLVSDGNATLDWKEVPASGTTARGARTLSVPADDERTYKITVAVTDAAGNLDFASERHH